ncbi:MAG: hypothetical protein JW384_02724 [Nitrosomonadaceae bacterium]|nr:hypothetical protein [Nitrosomonadaceae bacterium]
MCSLASSWAGRSPPHYVVTWPSTHSRWRSTHATERTSLTWYITAIAEFNTYPFASPNDWQGPRSSPPLDPRATVTIMLSLNHSTASTRLSSFIARDPGAMLSMSNGPRPTTSTGSTTSESTSHSTTCRQSSWRLTTMGPTSQRV